MSSSSAISGMNLQNLNDYLYDNIYIHHCNFDFINNNPLLVKELRLMSQRGLLCWKVIQSIKKLKSLFYKI